MPILYESLFDDIDLHLLSFLQHHAFGRYQDALAEAARIEKETGIPMTVESLKTVHFGWTEYKLPVGDTFIRLRTNSRFYPVGIFSTDQDFAALKWYRGAKVEYLYDWFTKFIALKEEKTATMTPQPVFKESFTFTVVSEVVKPKVDAWILGYVVLPETMRETPIRR